ncbi:hypothetical protein LF1_29050 [Rubripirellula obstinata]|uniref:Glycosyltransferase RgtA/B/C/D-like domain-containing protein n=2 Tax=Rubripirellula obstinata TaxID=406547 RepID=A0A5B1CKG4_9BACT|nr:hypothetical protein [Rubripirellula obstinata]KAA1260365.1 hypothetical protein LF1_29050 [Rubripirellula obstinata]
MLGFFKHPHCNSIGLAHAVFLLIALKVALWASLGPAAIVGDANGYWKLSSLVIDGDVMMMAEPIAYRTPIYPWCLAAFRIAASTLTSPLLVIIVAQASLYLASVYLAGELAVQISGRSSARLFAMLALLPAISAITYVGFLVSEILFVALLMLHLLSVVRYTHDSTAASAAWVGLTLGLTLLTRPIVLLLWIPHLIFVLIKHFSRLEKGTDPVAIKHRFGHVILASVVVVALCIPWLARNQRLFGEVFLTEFLGRNIWIVTFQDGSGAGLAMPESESAAELQSRVNQVTGNDWRESNWRHTWTVSNLLTESGLNDPAADRLMKTVAVEAMMTDPKTVAYKTVRRCVNFWRCPGNQLPTADPDYNGFQPYPKTWFNKNQTANSLASFAFRFRVSQSVAANTVLMVLIGVATLYLVYDQSTRVYGLWIASILVYFSVITGVVEIPDYRYRMVVEPVCASVVGSALSLLWPLSQNRNLDPASETAA